jgi:hypothetical protein
VQHPRERDLVVGTHGRSVYVLDDASVFAQLTQEVRNRPLALLETLPGTPRLYRRRSYGMGQAIFRAENPPLGATINFWVRDAAGEKVRIRIADLRGTALRELDAIARRGLNRVVWDLQADEKHRIPRVDTARLGQTQFVPPGSYRVTISMDEWKDEGTVEVRPLAGQRGN